MGNAEHLKWLQEGVESWNQRRSHQEFRPDFRDMDLGGVELLFADLKDARFGVDLASTTETDMERTVDLSYTQFSGANLTRAEFFRANLTESNFVIANLSGARFWDVDLTGANFLMAKDFRGTQFRECKLVGANLSDADLAGADFPLSKPWEARLFGPNILVGMPPESLRNYSICGIDDLLNFCRKLTKLTGEDKVLYFRGESRCSWDLSPSVMRDHTLHSAEGKMLNDLMTRQPEAFDGLDSALAQWVLAQHHGLKTRLLDITRNPLVGLFYACAFACNDKSHAEVGEQMDCNNRRHNGEDGRLHVFTVPRSLVKTFNSDSVSVVANLAKLSRSEQNLLLGKTKEDTKNDEFLTGADNVVQGPELFGSAKHHLYYAIRQEKPSFEEKLDIRDFFRVFVVEPQRMFERIKAQSGAFLVSAFHERFEPNEVQWCRDGIPYQHHVLEVPNANKGELLQDLQLLNVTMETLSPSVDESASAITQQYMGYENLTQGS